MEFLKRSYSQVLRVVVNKVSPQFVGLYVGRQTFLIYPSPNHDSTGFCDWGHVCLRFHSPWCMKFPNTWSVPFYTKFLNCWTVPSYTKFPNYWTLPTEKILIFNTFAVFLLVLLVRWKVSCSLPENHIYIGQNYQKCQTMDMSEYKGWSTS